MLKSIFEFAVNILKCDKYTSTENKSSFEEEKKIGSQLLVGCRTLFNTCCHTIDAQLLMQSEFCMYIRTISHHGVKFYISHTGLTLALYIVHCIKLSDFYNK